MAINVILCMIVKNEDSILPRCFTSGVQVADAICLCDTGSTDNTVEVAQDWAVEHEVRIHVAKHAWVDFGTNRTLAFQETRAFAKQLGYKEDTTYALLLDADMTMDANVDKNTLLSALHAGYYVSQINNSLSYWNIRFIRLNAAWACVGVTHEYWTLQEPGCARHPQIPQRMLHLIDHNDGGNRPEKYTRDVQLLRNALRIEPNHHRYTFYLAQTLKDMGEFTSSIDEYKKRIHLGGWQEEVWYSYLQIGRCYICMNDKDNATIWMLKAFSRNPARAEPLCELATFFRESNDHPLAYMLGKMSAEVPKPDTGTNMLFVSDNIYNYLSTQEVSISGFYLPHAAGKQSGYEACLDLVGGHGNPPKHIRELAQRNLAFYTPKYKDAPIRKTPARPVIVFYVGYSEIFTPNGDGSMSLVKGLYGSEIALVHLAESLVQTHNVIITSANTHPSGTYGHIQYMPLAPMLKLVSEIDPSHSTLVICRYVNAFLHLPCDKRHFRRVIMWIHDITLLPYWEFKNLPHTGGVLFQNTLQNVSHIITLTQWHKDYFRSEYPFIPEAKIKTTGNAVPDMLASQCQTMMSKSHRIPRRFIWTSSFDRGLTDLLKRFPTIQARLPGAEIHIYRDDPVPEGFENKEGIYFHGYASNEEIHEEMCRSFFWFYPTHFKETYCISALEAQLCGCMCIASSVAALPEILAGDRGVLIDHPVDSDAFWEAAIQCLVHLDSNPDAAEHQRNKAFAWASQQVWSKQSEAWKQLL